MMIFCNCFKISCFKRSSKGAILAIQKKTDKKGLHSPNPRLHLFNFSYIRSLLCFKQKDNKVKQKQKEAKQKQKDAKQKQKEKEIKQRQKEAKEKQKQKQDARQEKREQQQFKQKIRSMKQKIGIHKGRH